MKDVDYIRLNLGRDPEKRKGKVVIDGVVKVFVNDSDPFKMTLFPRNAKHAAVGRLFFMGLIDSFDDIIEIKDDADSIRFKINSRERELKRVESSVRVIPEILATCMKKLFESTDVWELTGGVHSAGLFDVKGKMLYNADDIGKGNAIDAVIGKGLEEGHKFSDCILASTGRQIGFMIEKAVRAGIPIVVSRGAPLYSSIKTAEKYNISLICFAKGRRMNIYTGINRII